MNKSLIYNYVTFFYKYLAIKDECTCTHTPVLQCFILKVKGIQGFSDVLIMNILNFFWIFILTKFFQKIFLFLIKYLNMWNYISSYLFIFTLKNIFIYLKKYIYFSNHFNKNSQYNSYIYMYCLSKFVIIISRWLKSSIIIMK